MADKRVGRWSSDETGLGTSAAIVVDLGSRQRRVAITRFIAVKSAGSSTTWGPKLLASNGSDDVAFAYATDTDPTDSINDVFSEPIQIETDSSGHLRLEPRFDAGADNDAAFILYYTVLA